MGLHLQEVSQRLGHSQQVVCLCVCAIPVLEFTGQALFHCGSLQLTRKSLKELSQGMSGLFYIMQDEVAAPLAVQQVDLVARVWPVDEKPRPEVRPADVCLQSYVLWSLMASMADLPTRPMVVRPKAQGLSSCWQAQTPCFGKCGRQWMLAPLRVIKFFMPCTAAL